MKPEVRQAFEQFARRQIDSRALAAATGLDWDFDPSTGDVEVRRPLEVTPPVLVGPQDVARALDDHQRGTLSDSELQEWANLIILCDSYELSAGDTESLASVLHQIASPEIFGDLTPEVQASLRRDLERLAYS